MSARARIGAALACLSLLAGCGGGTQTVTVNSPPPGSTASTAATTAAKAATETVAPKHISAFVSPSENIGCMLIGGLARCDIEHRSWKPPPRPKQCPTIVDFGQGIEIGASGEARFVCAGDTARDITAPKLAYGHATEAGGFTCESATTGMTCRRGDGHGFFISIQSYRLF